MKKEAEIKRQADILAAAKKHDEQPSAEDLKAEPGLSKGTKPTASRNIYTDIIHSLMEKNRKRVHRYYCANSRCKTRFFAAEDGYACPECGSLGMISEYKHDTAGQFDVHKPVLGYLDTIGRLFCHECAERFGMEEEVSLIVYSDSDPYCSEPCDVCRYRLNRKTVGVP